MTSERDYLQLRMNAADHLNDDMIALLHCIHGIDEQDQLKGIDEARDLFQVLPSFALSLHTLNHLVMR